MAERKTWAIVTGAGRGIGAALARHLSTRDLHVLAIDKDAEGLRELESEDLTGIQTLTVDLRDEDSVERITNAIDERDVIKYVIQNAAVTRVETLDEITRDSVEETLAVDVITPLLLVQKLSPRLDASNGRVIHLDVMAAHTHVVGLAMHGIAKAAYYHLYNTLNKEFEYAGSNVRVANVQVGAVDTPSFRTDEKVALQKGLPLGKTLKDMTEAGEVRMSGEAARFISYVLIDSSQEDFPSKKWCLNDPASEGKF